jgi:hypothetical protein
MTTPKTTAFFKQLLHHVSLRVTLDQQQQDLFLNMFQIRCILPRQYLLQQGDVWSIPCTLQWKIGGSPISAVS